MNKGRLEAFTDGVVAILITIMVLELHAPRGADLAALGGSVPTLLGYVLSFVFLGIYWNAHHHLLQAAPRVDGVVLWANLHLLFWLSLVPFATNWMGEHYAAPVPTAAYGVVLLLAAVAFLGLQARLRTLAGPGSALDRAVHDDRKGVVSLALNVAAVGLAFVRPWLADALYLTGALLWFVPDPRIERALHASPTSTNDS
jgi:uncharacterized membrane protein